jgi:hypothetical protein
MQQPAPPVGEDDCEEVFTVAPLSVPLWRPLGRRSAHQRRKRVTSPAFAAIAGTFEPFITATRPNTIRQSGGCHDGIRQPC